MKFVFLFTYRENVAESYRQLRSLLPVKQTNKLYNVRYNKTVLLEKAREYVHHLEATLKTLLQVCLLSIVKLWI